MFVDETGQKVNKMLAADMASHFQPYLMDSIESDSIISVIKYLNGINPEIDIYLLESSGMIKWFYPSQDPDAEVQIARVNTKPLDEFLSAKTLPIYGDDPLNEGVKKPFSVAPISIMGSQGCYLYVILSGQQFDEAAGMVQNSYILRNTFIGLGLILLVTLILGLIVFRLLTSRLRHVSETVKSFEQGQLEKRVSVNSKDEVGLLGSSFNQMADTLVSNMEEIKQIDKLRRELVANVSHELRTPLQSIKLGLETINEGHATNDFESQKKFLPIMLQQTERMESLVSDLLSLSKIELQEHIRPSIEIDLDEIINHVIKINSDLIKKRKMKIEYSADKDAHKILGDRNRLIEIFTNLIDLSLIHI